jgi:hypothetical protein
MGEPEAEIKPPSLTYPVASPASTGGAGTFFEQHVGAYWLAQLLVQAVPPIIVDCTVSKVSLQTEHLGWHTDDFLIIGRDRLANERKLAGQVKMTFTVSAANEECKKTIEDFWRDFKAASLFSPATDRFVLVTLRGTNALLQHFNSLLEAARAARDGAEFEHRLSRLLAKKAVSHCSDLCTIIAEVEGRSVTPPEIWAFLRVLYVLSLDLHTGTSQTEAVIKTLLAQTTTDDDRLSLADRTWDALLAVAARGMAEALTFTRDELPEDLQDRHSILGGTNQKVLSALKGHTDFILRSIRSTIGPRFHLARAALVEDVLSQLASAQVVLISGPAGSGKSAVARDAIDSISTGYLTFAFRAEEFAKPHFDSTLQEAQIPANAATLEAILAAQERKLLLVEGVERLLEKSTRDAFGEILTMAARDQGLQIILTCRDYSADLVRTSFLTSSQIGHSVVRVPQLDDSELAKVQASFPVLAQLLANKALRQILRNPYFLDKALLISWSQDQPLPDSERAFREIFWHQVVRADDRPAVGPPRLRDETFQEVAVRRARGLTSYASVRGLDANTVESLRRDSLLVSSPETDALVAPTHDVLEDWAILRWIEEQHLTGDGSFRTLSELIGGHPAIRRAYRRWVAELIERKPESAEKLLDDALADADVSPQFRDDTLVSILRAPSSPSLLGRRATELIANDHQLLKRLIHLLRIACVTTPAWLPPSAEQGSVFNVPDGPSWATILSMVDSEIERIAAKDRLLMLGLIEDWARGVSWWLPYPGGAESAARIAYAMLPHFDTYSDKGAGQRTLKVIAKIPKGDPARFEVLLRGASNGDEHDRTSEAFQDVIFSGLEGTATARDLPDLLVSVGKKYLLCSDADLERSFYYSSPLELETLFGMAAGLRHDFFPASAYRGPWLPLLRHHPKKGIDFLIEVFNHSADWYAHPRVDDRVEPPFEIELTFADGTSRKQWANPRLWNWYRGTSVGPYVLQSLVMAFEQWLLEVGETAPGNLDGLLVTLLRRSDSAALTAVIASAATAYVKESTETLLVMLRSPEAIWLDRQRLAMESQAPSKFSGMLGLSRGENEIYEAERKQSDARPHRKQDLEAAITLLQFGPLAPRVHEILDGHRHRLPPLSEQTDRDRTWRLSMHRMDLREYKVTKIVPAKADTKGNGEADDRHLLQLEVDVQQLEPDVKEMVDESTTRLGVLNAELNLMMWALHVFERDEVASYDPEIWHQQLANAQQAVEKSRDTEDLDAGRSGPGIVAAVCIRDHWNQMSDSEQEWCVQKACAEIMRQGDRWDETERVQRYRMSADRPCGSIISLLVGKPIPQNSRLLVQRAFVTALTHAIDEVRWYTAWGISRNLWPLDEGLAMRSVNATALEANLVDKAWDREKQGDYRQRRRVGEVEREAACIIRESFWQADGIPNDAYQSLDISTGFGADANGRILAMLSTLNTQAAVEGYRRTTQTIIDWWDADDDRKRHRDHHQERNHFLESTLADLVQNFIMQTSPEKAAAVLQSALNAVEGHPDQLQWWVRGLTTIEDRQRKTEQFWYLWKLFADRVRRASWVAHLDDRYSIGDAMVSAIFLGSWWKDEVRHWNSLEGHSDQVHALFEDLPPSSTVLDDYTRFLYHIGEKSLPVAFVRIAKKVRSGNAVAMLKQANTVFMLEVILQRSVYAKPLELKTDPVLRDSVLYLLDTLVDNGSSAAFRMRDDFVTPIANG